MRATDDRDIVVAWRHDLAVNLGYDQQAAAELADSRADIHDLELLLQLGYQPDRAKQLAIERIDVDNLRKLIAAGCSLDIAARVAWPLPTVATP